MSYKDKANKISQKYTDVTTSLAYVKEISFDENWKGKAKESLIPALKKAIEELEKVGKSIETYVSALQELDKYKTKKEMDFHHLFYCYYFTAKQKQCQ